uniref:Uncharacterized protein n=1 Tax=Anguilla anguilla TaxID=7936 RepID=A0A0E9X0F4_ANGAN
MTVRPSLLSLLQMTCIFPASELEIKTLSICLKNKQDQSSLLYRHKKSLSGLDIHNKKSGGKRGCRPQSYFSSFLQKTLLFFCDMFVSIPGAHSRTKFLGFNTVSSHSGSTFLKNLGLLARLAARAV